MILSILKLTLVPVTLLFLGLIERRHGARIAGWLAGFPIIVCPLLVFVAIDHGPEFAGAMALSAYFGLIAWPLFVMTYVQCARYWKWQWCAFCGAIVWGLGAVLISFAQNLSLWLAPLPFMSILLAIWLNPLPEFNDQEREHVWWGLPARILAGFALTLVIANFSMILGTRWSGILTTFPVLGSIVTISSHTEYGTCALKQAVCGLLVGLLSVAVFCLCAFLLLGHTNMIVAFAISLASSMGTHAITYFMSKTKPQASNFSA